MRFNNLAISSLSKSCFALFLFFFSQVDASTGKNTRPAPSSEHLGLRHSSILAIRIEYDRSIDGRNSSQPVIDWSKFYCTRIVVFFSRFDQSIWSRDRTPTSLTRPRKALFFSPLRERYTQQTRSVTKWWNLISRVATSVSSLTETRTRRDASSFFL